MVTGAITFGGVHVAHAQAPAKAAATKKVSKADRKKAIKSFKQGKKLLKAAEKDSKDGKKDKALKGYSGALTSFRKANELFPGDNPRFQIAYCLDRLGKINEALAAYDAFLAGKASERASKPKSKKKYEAMEATANQRVAAMKATLPATVVLSVTPSDAADLTISVDGKPAKPGKLSLKAGEHTVAVGATGFEAMEKKLTIKGGENIELPLSLKAVAEPATPAPPPPPPPPVVKSRSRVPAFVTLGVAGAGAIVGTIFGIQALGANSDFDENPTTDNADKAERAALIADMSFGVALTFGVTGAVLLFSEDPDSKDSAAKRLTVTPLIGTQGGGMAATWTF